MPLVIEILNKEHAAFIFLVCLRQYSSVLPSMLLESTARSITGIITYCVQFGLLLTPIGRSPGHAFMAQLTHGGWSFLLSCTVFLHSMVASSFSFPSCGPLSPSLGNLNPPYVSSAQLLAFGIFIYQL